MPRDIEELFASYILVQELGRPGKCGTEIDRPNTNRLYGAYFYNNSLDEGLKCYEIVKKAVERDKVYETSIWDCPIKVKFGEGYDSLPNIILKRGCTEFEQACGPSDQWAYDDAQVEEERILIDAFCQDIVHLKQHDTQLARVFYRWLHQAFRVGDTKYKMFTNGNDFYMPPVTYHNMDQECLAKVREVASKSPR